MSRVPVGGVPSWDGATAFGGNHASSCANAGVSTYVSLGVTRRSRSEVAGIPAKLVGRRFLRCLLGVVVRSFQPAFGLSQLTLSEQGSPWGAEYQRFHREVQPPFLPQLFKAPAWRIVA